MPTIRIDLREGFEDDDVRVSVDDTRALERSSISTDYSIGLAARVEHDVPIGSHTIEVATPTSRVRRTVVVHDEGVRLDVVLDEGTLSVSEHEGPDKDF